ncbi:condensation domain-containing protein, partial [Globomyces pollinis-pini]
FDLLPLHVNIKEIENCLEDVLEIPYHEIQDIYPATPMQAGLLSSMIQVSSEYVVQQIWEIDGNCDIQLLQKAWSKVVENHSILRTAFCSTSDGMYQLVLTKDFTNWNILKDCSPVQEKQRIEEFILHDRAIGFELKNKSFVRFNTMNRTILIQTMHHSIIDGWSSGIIFNDWIKAYKGQILNSSTQFRAYVEHFLFKDMSCTENFWTQSFSKVTSTTDLPFLQRSKESNQLYNTFDILIELNMDKFSNIQKTLGITANTIFRAAWALV